MVIILTAESVCDVTHPCFQKIPQVLSFVILMQN